MYMPENNFNKKKKIYNGVEEALNKRSLLNNKKAVCTFRSVFEEKNRKMNDKGVDNREKDKEI